MTNRCCATGSGLPVLSIFVLLSLLLSLIPSGEAFGQSHPEGELKLKMTPSPKAELNLKEISYNIVYETFRKTNGKENWELYLINADGTNAVNLTNTPDADEMFPHASPDGTKLCCVVDEIVKNKKVRNVYCMNIDGTDRMKVAENARQPCWSADGTKIAYLKGEFERYAPKIYATSGLFFYDIKTRQHREHPNKKLHHLFNICWSPDGEWFVATVHGGMGFKHAQLAIEANGMSVYDLTQYGVTGCRPEFGPDGTRLTWGKTDWDLCVGKIDLTAAKPKVTDVRRIVACDKEHEVYHTDFSPDGKYIAFSYGPKANENVGGKAPGWNICVTDLAGHCVQVTTDGHHNKEPDWVPIGEAQPAMHGGAREKE
jgi:Tol biopolymer transport system component